jgi:proteasome lid subunit RPN8/RPN11
MAGRDDRARLTIAPHLLAAVGAAAREAYPRECCGYLVGPRDGDDVDELVACTNAAAARDEYAIDGIELIVFARAFATRRPPRVVYHSHSNGRAYFSVTDREHALAGGDRPAYPVQHLVVGVNASGCAEAVLFAWNDDTAGFVAVSRFAAAELA